MQQQKKKLMEKAMNKNKSVLKNNETNEKPNS